MIVLRRPTEELVLSYLDFIDEMRQYGDKIWPGFFPSQRESHLQFIHRLLKAENDPEDGRVRETTYWPCEAEKVVGRIALRHDLNENLREFGGHIGYEVRPSSRGRGVAKEMLRLVLQTTEARSIGRLLLTCSPNNIASNKTILANGGTLSRTAYVEKWQRDTNYCWIDIL